MEPVCESEPETARAELERVLFCHGVDLPDTIRRVNAQEVLSKQKADTESQHVTRAVFERNSGIVSGKVPSIGADLLRCIRPYWERSDTLVHMLNFESEARSLDAFIATCTQGDATSAVLKIGGSEYAGFGGYGQSFSTNHVRAVQESSTVLLKRSFFTQTTIRNTGITPIHALEAAVRNNITNLASGFDLRLLEAHIIRQGTLIACWRVHLDNTGNLKRANITAVVNVTPYETSMRIVGSRQHADYLRQGDTAVFAADMWHYTSRSSVGTIKLALFYTVRPRSHSHTHLHTHAHAHTSDAHMPIKKRKIPQ